MLGRPSSAKPGWPDGRVIMAQIVRSTVCRRARSALSRNSSPGMLTVSCQLFWWPMAPGLGILGPKNDVPASLCEIAEMRMHVVGDRGAGMIRQPGEASRQCPGGDPVEVAGCPVPIDASACRRQDDRCFSLAAGEVGPIDAVDDGFFPVGHHDRVAEDVDRAEAEELPLNRIDDTDSPHRARAGYAHAPA